MMTYQNDTRIQTFCGFSMGSYQYWAGRVYNLCVYFMMGTPEGSTESGFMEKTGIEPATPGLQNIGEYTKLIRNGIALNTAFVSLFVQKIKFGCITIIHVCLCCCFIKSNYLSVLSGIELGVLSNVHFIAILVICFVLFFRY